MGGVDSGSSPTMAIYLTINAEGIVTDINDRARSAPPLEPIRAKQRAGEPWVLDAATAEFRDWDSASTIPSNATARLRRSVAQGGLPLS